MMPSEHGDGHENEQVIGLVTILIDGLIREAHELMDIQVTANPELEIREAVLVVSYRLGLGLPADSKSARETRNNVLLELGTMISKVRKAITESREAEANSQLRDEPVLSVLSVDQTLE